uniref:UPF0235 protein ENS19_07565 n=1 Tax=Candidatus Methanomethylicus mesodigestus TaxID=1867258 RepID=A0A7C3J4B4_9CREN
MNVNLRESKNGIIVTAYVRPNAKKNSISFGETIEIETTEPAEQNKANSMAIALISKRLRVPKSSVQIVRGSRSKLKEILLVGVTKQQMSQIDRSQNHD